MSLQILKKKSDATSPTKDNGKLFTINGGPKNLSYIGKNMRNSTVKTPFRGTLPVNYVNNAATSSTVMVNPLAKAEMGSTTAQAYQRSVGNTKSMIASKYMWIRGQYPNAVSQPCTNITSSEHTRNVGVIPVFHAKNQRDGRCVTQPIPVSSSSACRPVINQPSSTHNIMQRLANCNAVGNNQPTTATVGGFSEYMSRILATELIKKGDDKPFPFYINNHCGTTVTYTSAPDWYKNNTLLKCENE